MIYAGQGQRERRIEKAEERKRESLTWQEGK
jgi:hypothetical protein